MAGKPGRSGGSRPGAGRPPPEETKSAAADLITDDPEAFLIGVMRDPLMSIRDRKEAAIEVLKYRTRTKTGPQGKKGQKADAAEEAAGGRFSPQAPPKLHAVK